MSRRVVPMEPFREMQRALGLSAEGEFVLQTLIQTAVLHPHKAPEVEGTYARMLISRAYADYPALCLVYRLKDDVVYLYGVDRYDELSEEPRAHV